MRNIFPNQEQTNNLFNQEKDVATKQDIQDLSTQISAISTTLTNVAESLSQYIASMGANITTGQINALQAAISTLEATSATLTSANITNLTVSGTTGLADLTANLATIVSDLTVGGDAYITGNIEASDATFDEITATTANITNWVVENLTVNKVTATEIEADDIKSNGTITTDDIEAATGDIDTLNSLEITAENITVNEKLSADLGIFDEEKIGNIHWKEYVDYPNTSEVYLTIPHYENGTYYLRANGPTETLFTVEVFNSVDNYFVRWSQKVGGYIAKIYKLGDGANAQICLHIVNVENVAFTLEYATICATPNVAAPVGSVNPPATYDTRYFVTYQHGSKFFRLVDLANQGSDSHVLSKRLTNDYSEATQSYDFDGTSNVTDYDYIPNQSLNTDDDVQFNTVHVSEFAIDSLDIPEDLTVGEKITTPNIYNGPSLTAAEKAALADDTLLIETDNGTISRKTTKASAVQVKPFIPYDENNEAATRPLVYDATNDVLKKATGDIDVPGDLTVAGDTDITGDTTIGGTLDVTGNTTLGGTLDVSGDTKITGDAFVSGDLIVSGTVHSIDQEEVVAAGNTITLRANNNLPLATGQVSGVVVNKYNGTDDLTVAAGNDGTLRVGTASGTDTSYTKIALNHTDGKYYTYDDTATPVTYTLLNPQPSGNMTAWTGKDVVEGYTHYATATFTVIDTTTLAPITTRDEEANMDDGAVVIWDATSTSVKTAPLPTNNAQALVSKWVEDPTTHVVTKSYEWKAGGSGSVSRYPTMAAALAAIALPEGSEGYVPDNGIVIIDELSPYISGEDR